MHKGQKATPRKYLSNQRGSFFSVVCLQSAALVILYHVCGKQTQVHLPRYIEDVSPLYDLARLETPNCISDSCFYADPNGQWGIDVRSLKSLEQCFRQYNTSLAISVYGVLTDTISEMPKLALLSARDKKIWENRDVAAKGEPSKLNEGSDKFAKVQPLDFVVILRKRVISGIFFGVENERWEIFKTQEAGFRRSTSWAPDLRGTKLRMDVNAILHALDKYPCIGYNLQAYISSTGNIYLVDPDLSPPQTHDNTTCTQFRKKARAKLRDILDIFVPIRWKSSYKGRAFREYHERIEEKIQTTYLPHRDVQNRSYELPAYEGEFGMELRVMVPWAFYLSQRCALNTSGFPGTKYMYFFSPNHRIISGRRGYRHLPKGNPLNSSTPHIHDFSAENWHPPPFKKFFFRDEVRDLLDRPVIFISNKFTSEWGGAPVNYFSTSLLFRIMKFLTPHYDVIYKRDTHASHVDHQGGELHLDEKKMMVSFFPSVVLFEDLAFNITDPEEVNLLLFSLMSMARLQLSVQGGAAVVSSYFGGTNIILIKKGNELAPDSAYAGYFRKFSNATIEYTSDDEDFIHLVEKYANPNGTML